jgi:hypothetical protein
MIVKVATVDFAAVPCKDARLKETIGRGKQAADFRWESVLHRKGAYWVQFNMMSSDTLKSVA